MCGTVDRIPEKPSWAGLYVLATLAPGLLGVVDALVPAGAWRRTLEVVITVVGFGAIHLWVRANRRALDLAGERAAGFRRVIEPPSDLEPVGSDGSPGRRCLISAMPRARQHRGELWTSSTSD